MMRCFCFLILSAFLLSAALADDDKSKEKPKEKPKDQPQAKKNNILKDLVPDEILNFFTDLPWEEQEYLDELKKEVAEAHKKKTPLSVDQINDKIKEKSPELYEKKLNVLHAVNKKVDALTSKGKEFIQKLHVTSLISGHDWGVGSSEKMFALLRKEIPALSEDDRKTIVEHFPKFKTVFEHFLKKKKGSR